MTWVILVLLLVCSGTVSASETALFGLSRQMLFEFGQSNSVLRRRVFLLMQHPRRVLLTVLMANTAVNVAIFAVSFLAVGHEESASPAKAALVGVIVLFFVIVFGEMVPKAVALRGARLFAPHAAALVYVLQTVFGPLGWLLATFVVDPMTRLFTPSRGVASPVSTEELRLLVEHSARAGHLNATENDMLQAVVGLSDVSVRDIMTPRVDIRSISIDADRESALRVIEQSGRRRLPVYGRDLDDIRGVLHTKDLFLNPDAPIRSLVHRVRFFPEQANLMQLLRYFRQERIQLAIVVDEFGGTAGLVSIEDVVKWIMGDLPDHQEMRSVAPADRIDENTYRLSGDLSVRVWADRFGVTEVDRDVDTIGGLILARLGRMPKVGDQIRIRNLTLTVESIRRRRIERVLLQREPGLPSRADAAQSKQEHSA
jgi:putative hemolysin